ncbi:MAG TPA: UDP-N-acetylmuramoyl-L-alanyl-D-glutamate--2,6-diaminopimelate ligase [Treponemataceae bacterium]|nr:UDP-N-acetylmuramoyl-L-alanyl-D-glutamate--2,6-diaminopimelate ligase [Treponemataceae bacterium]
MNREKNLDTLLSSIKILEISSPTLNPLIQNLVFDSRNVTKGSLFFALPGNTVHGNTFIQEAIKKGAVAIIYQDEIPSSLIQTHAANIVMVKVQDSRYAMSPIADSFYDSPSSKLKVIGVTGTEGKSTTTYLIWQLIQLLGAKAGFISTVQTSFGDRAFDNTEHLTTPEAPVIHYSLAKMLENNCEYAIIESSSHGLSKKTNRCGDIHYDVGIVTNVTHEHLEFHGTREQYAFDKANLFRSLDLFSHEKTVLGLKSSVPTFGVINADDSVAFSFLEDTKQACFFFSEKSSVPLKEQNIDSKAFFYASNIISSEKKLNFTLTNENLTKQSVEVETNLIGTFNVHNILASIITVSKIMGKSIEEVAKTCQKLIPVKGRMSSVDKGQNFEVIIDYAHTPSSFNTIFPPIRDRAQGKIISVFGSGGNRDTKKRPEQGAIAARYSDIVILTDEDPRTENSMDILTMIAEGCKNPYNFSVSRGTEVYCKADSTSLFLIPDRKKAIRKAFSLASKNDIVLLLGKAHENSIIYADHIMPYDEIEEAISALAEMGYKKG